MKRTTSILVITAGVLLYGCSASPVPTLNSSPTTGTPPATTSPTPAGSGATPFIAGNWQFTAMSSSAGTHAFSIAGGLNQAAGTAAGTVHIDNPNCFDPLVNRQLTGSLSAATATLTATGSDGQVVTLSGSFTNATYDVIPNTVVSKTFTGTYSVEGGCAAGDRGTVTGEYIDSIGIKSGAWQWSGTFTNGSATNTSAQQVFHGTGQIVQNDIPDPPGSFSVGGDATFDVACLSAGTMKVGAYPSASFILGTSVALEFDMNSGVLNFAGTLDPDTNQISGSYTVSGSSCNQSGSAVVQIPTGCPGCWDY